MKPIRFTSGALLRAGTALGGLGLALCATPALAQDAPPPAPPAGTSVPGPETPPTESPAAQTDAPQADAPAAEGAESGDDLGEIVVRGRFIPEPKRETAEIAAFLSSEDFARQGDDNAAAALTRVTGLSLIGGRFIYVRGLGERYSSALLNGLPLPSPEPLRRVVPLDLFPTNILESSNVQKTFSPNFTGEFGGGLVDLRTKGVPDEGFLDLKVSAGVNTVTTFRKGLIYDGGDIDWTGFDDGTRKIPEPLAVALATGKRVDSANFTPTELQTIGRSLVNAPLNVVQTNEIPADIGVEVSGGTKWDIGNNATLGFVAVLGYDSEWRSRAAIQQEGTVDLGRLVVTTDYDAATTQNDIVVNGLLSLGLEWGDNEIKSTSLYIRSTTKRTKSRVGRDDLASADVRDDSTDWVARTLINTQLTGAHLINDALSFNWRGAYATSERNSPYEKAIRYRLVNGLYQHDTLRDRNRTRFSLVKDEVLAAGFDVTYKLDIGRSRVAEFKAGYDYTDTQRDSESREFRFRTVNILPDAVQRSRVDFLFSDVNINPSRLQIGEVTGSEGAAAYEGSLKVQAGYAMVDAEILPLVRASAGVRFEKGEQQVETVDLFSGNRGGPPAIDKDYWLPSATLTWNFYDDMQLRVGGSKTIARPQFRELAPSLFIDIDNDRVYIGNPFLLNSDLTNFDARWEWYFDRDQFLTVGAFYKDIKRPVEEIVNEVGAELQTTFINAPKARLWGFELEFKKFFAFDFQTPWLQTKRWLVNANYTFSDAKVKVGADDVVFPLSGNGASRPATNFVRDGQQLQGQSKHLLNLQLGYEDDEAQSQATLLLTWVDKRISARGRPGQPDILQKPGFLLDFVYRKSFEFSERSFDVSFNARNLLGEDSEEFQQIGDDRIDVNTYDLGRTFSISLTANF